jgi:hypothetical protein
MPTAAAVAIAATTAKIQAMDAQSQSPGLVSAMFFTMVASFVWKDAQIQSIQFINLLTSPK